MLSGDCVLERVLASRRGRPEHCAQAPVEDGAE
jgi:hypothetical protein